ncbi:MAG: undecaprenyl-diphosphate phosphatase [Acidobacteriota bacterium]|nr:MAG: undecaprenyl-diphosphate phosphatase [Acidobacteriota bacterium]
MIILLQVIFLAVLQGITEFLPVSSSGHLAIAEYFMGFQSPGLTFEVLVHAGTLVSVIAYFRKDIGALLGFGTDSRFVKHEHMLLVWILVGSVPTGILGFVLQDAAVKAFRNLAAVGVGFLATAVVLYFASRIHPEKIGIETMDWYHAVTIGAMQGIAVMPGVSRAGVTISTALFGGLDRRTAFSFSFLLSIPAVLGATIGEASHLTEGAVSTQELGLYAMAFAVSAVVGYGALHALRRIVESARFSFFAYYCALLGVVTITVKALSTQPA